MAKQRTLSSAEREHSLVAPLERLADELQLVRTVLDELRFDIQWAVQNGAFKARRSGSRDGSALPALTLFNQGDAVDFSLDGQSHFGEVVDIDDANNLASVVVIPSNEVITVSQDALTKQDPDPLQRETIPQMNDAMPEPGNLF